MTIFEEDLLDRPRVRGSGGGGKDGGGSGATEDPNTLQSRATARIIDLLGEGEIAGLVDGAKSIYFNDTPLQGPDGQNNFQGVTWAWRSGLPDQPHIDGFAAAETEQAVSVEVTASQPVVRTIADPNVDGARVTINIPALVNQDTSNGDLHGTSVRIAIDVRANGGAWTTKVDDTITGKTTSGYERAYRIALAGSAPWDVRVRRMTPDSTSAALNNKTYFSHYSEIIDGKFTYPDSALIALTIDSQQFGSQVPTRAYEVNGLKVKVPANYDPTARTYGGLWNGTFKLAWTDNPAWVLYDILTNPRYGLGDSIAATQVDKWSLYQIAQYCDQGVPSGRKNADGTDILEPRYTFNGAIVGREDAYQVVQAICSVFRGMAFWAAGSVCAKADMPGDPVKLVSPANVLGGTFTYSGTALKARHTVALVTWNDPEDAYKPTIEVVENPEMIARYGWRPIEITAFGCTKRSQARRMGMWMLDSEQHETETVTYEASFDHADVSPGDLISLADPSYANARFGGRLAAIDAAGTLLTLDDAVDLDAGQSYSLSVVLPDGTIGTQTVVNAAGAGRIDRLSLSGPFAQPPEPNAMWVLTASNLAPRLFRVRAVREKSKNTYEITALRHDPTKYARIENGLYIAEPPYIRPTNEIPAPGNLTAQEARYQKNGAPRSRVTLSWSAAEYQYLTGYRLTVITPSGAVYTYGPLNTTSYDLDDVEIGAYRFEVRTVAWNGSTSRPAVLALTTRGWEEIPDLSVSHLQVDGQGADTTFSTRDPLFTWRGNFPDTSWELTSEPGAGAGRVDPRFRDYVVRIYDPATKTLLRTEYTTKPEFRYFLEMNRADSARIGAAAARRRILVEVAIRDTLWRESRATRLEAYNPPLPLPKNLNVTSGIGVILITFDLPDENDFAGTYVWRSESPGFITDADHVVAQGRDNSYVIPSDPNIGYYVRVAHYDAFGTDEANITDEIFVEAAFIVDTTPPDRPDKPQLTTGMGEDGKARVTATWNASTARDFAQFEIAIKRTDEGEDQWQFVTTTGTSYTWTVDPNVSYDVMVRAVDSSANRSAYSEIATIVSTRDSTPPAPVTDLAADAGFRSAWLTWTNPSDPDYAYAEIWEGATSNRDAAIRLGTQAGTPGAQSVATRSGLQPGDRLFYWVRPVDTSGNAGDWTGPVEVMPASLQLPDFPADFGPIPLVSQLPADGPQTGVQYAFLTSDQKLYKWDAETQRWKPAFDFTEIEGQIAEAQIGSDSISTPKLKAGSITTAKLAAGAVTADQIAANAITAGKIQAGAITADKIAATAIITQRAQIANAIIDSAHIAEIDASKIRAGSVLAGSVTVNGQALGDVATAVGDPTVRINQGSTRIDPGKITIAGSTTLGDWRAGPNSAEINGGAISANTISANRLTIGARGIVAGGGLQFEPRRNENKVVWTAGNIQYIDENGTVAKVDVSGGEAYGANHIYWVRGSNSLSASSDHMQSIGNDRIRLASYYGGSNLVAHFGGTIIDGERLVTGSITANQIAANAISARHIEAQSVTGAHIRSNEVIINSQNQLGLRVVGSAQIDNLAVDRAHIRDLTINGQKIEDFAVSNMNAAQGTTSATVSLSTTGKRVLITAVRGAMKSSFSVNGVSQGGGDSGGMAASFGWTQTPISFATAFIEQPGPGVHSWTTYNTWFGDYLSNEYYFNHYCAISAVELRK
ncbi:TipJ family phage tail tip protein [Azospirillum sp.]|uniref:TipJ family phage tail tip protein n=1 Tax=Azospirillum sp. TaxID=34012 RepID=UPI003D74C3C1